VISDHIDQLPRHDLDRKIPSLKTNFSNFLPPAVQALKDSKLEVLRIFKSTGEIFSLLAKAHYR
jgi:hypothetical protein